MVNPVEYLAKAATSYPDLWRQVDKFRADRGKKLPDWPSWCFLPMAGWGAIVCARHGLRDMDFAHANEPARLAALGAWRPSQGIYRFDPDLYATLASTPLTGELPSNLLFRLPEWCVYIETPDLVLFRGTGSEPIRADGVFAHLEYDMGGQAELRLLFAQNSGELIAVPLELGDGTGSFDDAWHRTLDTCTKNMATLSPPILKGGGVNPPALAHPFAAIWGSCPCVEASRTVVNLVLYLCSQEPEVRDETGAGLSTTGHPIPKRTKKGWRLFPPDRPRIWHVGTDIGRCIREGRTQTRTPGARPSPHPHIRRAHWHGFWKGPKKTPGARSFVVKWLPPIPVAMPDNEKDTPVSTPDTTSDRA